MSENNMSFNPYDAPHIIEPDAKMYEFAEAIAQANDDIVHGLMLMPLICSKCKRNPPFTRKGKTYKLCAECGLDAIYDLLRNEDVV